MKHRAKHVKKTKIYHKKSVPLLTALVLICTIGIGGTLAYIVDTSETLTNIFSPAEVACAVEESYEVKNIGSADAYVRVAVLVTWKDPGGNVLGKQPSTNEYSLTWGTGWKEGADGYYYWPSALAVNEETNPIITNYSAEEGKSPAGYTLSVQIVAEAIQAEPARAVQESWGVPVNDDGTISAP